MLKSSESSSSYSVLETRIAFLRFPLSNLDENVKLSVKDGTESVYSGGKYDRDGKKVGICFDCSPPSTIFISNKTFQKVEPRRVDRRIL